MARAKVENSEPDLQRKEEYQRRIKNCSDPENPWRDKELMEYLYVDEKLSQLTISRLFSCSSSTIGTWVREHEFDVRTRYETMKIDYGGGVNHVAIHTTNKAQVVWTHRKQKVLVHRLMAVAEFGFDAVCGMEVHHGSRDEGPNELPPAEISWANWPGNLELMTESEHASHHRKCTKEQRIELAKEYYQGGISQKQLGEKYGVSRLTVGRYLREIEEEYGIDRPPNERLNGVPDELKGVDVEFKGCSR